MKKITVIYFLLFLIILTGCNSIKSNDQNITEEKAKQIVIDERSRECCGDAEIITIISKTNKYIIQWEIDSLKEEGTDSIHKKTGKIKAIESTRGTCKIK
ncbi:lipoprotein [Virgibacillus alimentarius]|nr:lipoprotein [Virgibacillus alimentarius]